MIRRAAALAGTALIVLAAGGPAEAEPSFAIRTGYRCSQCHVNRTGGGMRTAFGSLWAQTVLPARLLRWRDGGNLLPADPEARFAAGGDFRFQYLFGESRDTDDVSSFEVPEANLYLLGRLIPGKLELYLDGTTGPGGASAREAFAQLSFGGAWRAYLKAGKFLPPFGWRLPDDDAFVRRFSGFTYSAPDQGVEIGAEPGRWSTVLAVVNGSGAGDDDRTKKVSLMAVRRIGSWRLGASGSSNDADGVRTTFAGALAGASWGRLTVLGELDWAELDPDDAPRTEQLLGYIEADVLIARGLQLKLAHDWRDPNRDISTLDETRDLLGLEYLPWPFLQLRLVAQRRDGPPQLPDSDDRSAFFELHLFF